MTAPSMTRGVLATIAILAGLTAPALADVTFIPAGNRVDTVFDSSGILYITDGSKIDRYNTITGTTLPSFNVGGTLKGIDISPDGKTLAVADGSRTGIDLISTATGSVNQVNFTPTSQETGAFSVAYGSDGKLLVSTSLAGSGFVPLRQYDPATGAVTTISVSPFNTVRQDTMLTASADRSTIGLAEGNQTGGPIHAYSVASASITATTSIPGGFFTYEIAANRNGSQFVVPTYDGAFVYNNTNGTLTQQTVLGSYASHGPIDAVYSPTSHYLFTAEYDYSDKVSGVKVYDTNTFTQVASLDNFNFPWTGNDAYGDGRMKISADGRELAVSVNGGVNLYNVTAYSVPEPSSLVLAAMGLASALVIARRRNAKAASAR